MTSEPTDPAKKVTVWIKMTTPGLKSGPLLQLFDATFHALQRSAQPMLGTVVLSAILERVLYNSGRQYPLLRALKIHEVQIDFSQLSKQAASFKEKELIDAFQDALAEFFLIVDRLTGEILTPVLYKELRSNGAHAEEKENK